VNVVASIVAGGAEGDHVESARERLVDVPGRVVRLVPADRSYSTTSSPASKRRRSSAFSRSRDA
jgi:hypothetical protein